MSSFQPTRRATLLIPSGPAHDLSRHHLFILVTDSIPNPLNCNIPSNLLVSISTVDPSLPYDQTCTLSPADHPFVNRDSYVVYRESVVLEAAKIVKAVDDERFIVRSPIDSAIVDRICDGLLTQPSQTPEKIKRFYRTYLRLTATF